MKGGKTFRIRPSKEGAGMREGKATAQMPCRVRLLEIGRGSTRRRHRYLGEDRNGGRVANLTPPDPGRPDDEIFVDIAGRFITPKAELPTIVLQ